MHFSYNILVILVNQLLKFIGLFNYKIKQGVTGRKASFKILKDNIKPNTNYFWFHCASLGEYEQGLPVFEELKKQFPDYKIVLSFFSPSGYNIRKNSPIADVVIYLPLDTTFNAKKLISLIQPKLTVFVKYDIWPNYLNELKKQKLDAILISAAFRPNHIYFKWYGSFFKKALFKFKYIFTQNKNTKTLLEKYNYSQVIETGDTRFDRVSNQLKTNNSINFIEEFINNKKCVVIGSSWGEDLEILIPYINNAPNDLKFIIAPHEINTQKIKQLREQLNKASVSYSERLEKDLSIFNVFIVDTIGLLSKIYTYANIAYVGGAMGKTGLHNILEPAVFGIPVLFGKNHKRFPEAQILIDNGGAFSVSNLKEITQVLNNLLNSEEERKQIGQKNSTLINKSKGATKKIINHINQNLLK